MDSARIAELVHPAVIWQPLPIPDDQNALFPWRKASAALTELDELNNLFDFVGDCECEQPECKTCHPIPKQEFEARGKWVLAANASSLKQIRHGLELGRLKLELDGTKFDDAICDLQAMRTFGRMLYLQATVLQYQGRLPDAARVVGEVAKLGSMVAAGGIFVQLMVGQAITGCAIELIKQLGALQFDKDTLNSLLDRCMPPISKRGFANAMRREFCLWTLPKLEEYEAIDSDAERIDHLLKDNLDVLSTTFEPFVDDGRLAERNAQIRYVLTDHPRLWNLADAVRESSQDLGEQILALEADEPTTVCRWSTSDWWPSVYNSGAFYEMLGESAEAQEERKKLAELMEVPPDEVTLYDPIAPTELPALRARVYRVDNPIGKLITVTGQLPNVDWLHSQSTERLAKARQLVNSF